MNLGQTILLVDDEVEIVELLRDFLEAEGYQIRTACTGQEALSCLRDSKVDCLLLDIMMPDVSGFDLCRQIRETNDVPIMYLSARQDDIDKIRGLGLGADDYIVKSVTPAEIVARIKAVLRRYRRDLSRFIPAPLNFGELTLDMHAHEVYAYNQLVYLTAKEFELLLILVEHPRQVFNREQLYEKVWGDYGDLHTITVHIGRLREKIEKDPAKPRWIHTVWGVGYKFEDKRP